MLLTSAGIFLVAAPVSAASIAFAPPPGGWTYVYTGDAAAGGTGTTGNNFDALDGTWDRQSGTDSWDGSALGGAPFAEGNAPGGISALTDGDTAFARIQDPGNPTTAPTSIPDPSNRRVYVGHDIGADAGVVNPAAIGEAVTLSFRARVATEATGLIDPMFTAPTGAENAGVAHGTAWPAEGNGWLGHDGGKGNFSIRQSGAGAGAGVLSFSLGLAEDARSDHTTPFGTTGLNMNSLNGTAPSGTVDPFQNEGTVNVLPIADLTNWHEFWITIQADQSGGGTHRVDVYLDGSLTPNTFHVTSGTGNDYTGLSYLGMGLGATPQMGAIDVDFYAYKEGVFRPIPEPATVMLALLAACAGCATGGRRR